jgi:hypothetical protein
LILTEGVIRPISDKKSGIRHKIVQRGLAKSVVKFFLHIPAVTTQKTPLRSPNYQHVQLNQPSKMKFLLGFLVAGAVLVSPVLAQVPVGPNSIKLGKVSVSAPTTPEFQVTGGQNKRYQLGKWLEFEIPYDTVPDEIDELTFRFTAAVEGRLLVGEVTYVNIAKGKDHYAVMYLSPKAINKLTGGKPLSSAGVENVWVTVERQGQVLGKEQLKPGNPRNLPQLTGLILNKNQTPFGPLYYDRYEEIKPTR